jgi:hypothetical protein
MNKENRTKAIVLIVTVLAAVMVSSRGFCQGLHGSTYTFLNYVQSLLDAPVFDADGTRLAGTDYVAALYGGMTPDTLELAWHVDVSPMAPVPFTLMPGGQAGYFRDPGGFVSIPTVPCGQVAWLKVRAWDARLGASYEEVVSLGLGGYGESNLFEKRGGNLCLGVATPPELLIGLQSFSLLPVIPEPSPLWLVLLGLPLLALRRRRLKRT